MAADWPVGVPPASLKLCKLTAIAKENRVSNANLSMFLFVAASGYKDNTSVLKIEVTFLIFAECR